MIKSPALKAGSIALAVAALGFGVAACGSSTTKAAGVVLAPGDGATVAAVTTTAAAATATATSTVTTPTTGALSKEPTASQPNGSAPTKLETKTLVAGTGAAVTLSNYVTVNYYGYNYATGKPFSGGSTWTSGTTATPVGPVQITTFIKGWEKGLVGVKAGSRVQLTIPPSLAYKGTSSPLAKDTLVFVIDVLKVSSS